MNPSKLKPFNLNSDTARSDLLHGIPVVVASVLFTFLLLMLLSANAGAADPPPEPTTSRVELNSASLSQLMELPGIGATRARDIVEYRRKRTFKRPSDLLRIRGIGRRTYLRLKPLVQVEPKTTPALLPKR